MKKLFYLLSAAVLMLCSCSKDGDVDNPNILNPEEQGDDQNLCSSPPQYFLLESQELRLTDHANINLEEPIKDFCLGVHIKGVKSTEDGYEFDHAELCKEYGVRFESDRQGTPDGTIDPEVAKLPTYPFLFDGMTEHLTGIDVIVGEGWDAAHPAGSSLNDIIRTYDMDYVPCLKAYLAGDHRDYDRPMLLSQMQFDPEGLYAAHFQLFFLSAPANPGMYTVTVRVSFADGKILENSVVMDWTENNIPPDYK